MFRVLRVQGWATGPGPALLGEAALGPTRKLRPAFPNQLIAHEALPRAWGIDCAAMPPANRSREKTGVTR